MPTSADTGRPAITPEIVTTAAASLTHRSHLLGWSIRDLTAELGVSPSVIYHHVGGKDLLSRHVVERALAGLPTPARTLPWQDWYRELLADLYPRLTAYPGSAKWLLMHGPTFPTVMSVIGTGMAVLDGAGFADAAGIAYATLLNTPLLTLTVGDDRLVHEDDGPRDHGHMMAEFREAAAAEPGVRVLTEQFVRQFAESDEGRDQQRRDNYDFVIETVIAGLQARLETGTL